MNLTKSQTLINYSKLSILSIQDIQAKLDAQMSELLQCDKCGNYVKADELKISIEQLKKELNEKKLAEIVQNHKKDQKKLEMDNSAEMN
jgi:transcription initiation factor IIE alpha subunit